VLPVLGDFHVRTGYPRIGKRLSDWFASGRSLVRILGDRNPEMRNRHSTDELALLDRSSEETESPTGWGTTVLGIEREDFDSLKKNV